MGFMFTGIIVKNGTYLSDEDILQMLGRKDYYYDEEVSLEKAISSSFQGIAIARVSELLLLFGADIAYSCSFGEKNELSETDEKMKQLSKQGDILCFITNSVASTYAWSVFSKGQRVRTKAIEEQEILSEVGEVTAYEKGITMDDQGIILLIENFTGYSFIELVFGKSLPAAAYNH